MAAPLRGVKALTWLMVRGLRERPGGVIPRGTGSSRRSGAGRGAVQGTENFTHLQLLCAALASSQPSPNTKILVYEE